jgi:hypothetical protein
VLISRSGATTLCLSKKKERIDFKGDFWVNDSTYAIKKINMAVTRSQYQLGKRKSITGI